MLVKMNNIVNSPSVLMEGSSTKPISWNGEQYSIVFADRFEVLSDRWPTMERCPNVLMSSTYVKTVETASADLIGFLYALVVDENDQLVACYYFQMKQFNAAQSLNYSPGKSVWQRLQNRMKRLVASTIDSRGLVCGNLLVTGDHGKIWLGPPIDEHKAWNLHAIVHENALEYSNQKGKKIGFVLGKDFVDPCPENQYIDWNAVKVQPNMVLYLPAEWNSMQDYLMAMKSKYRKRTRAALRKVNSFRFMQANESQIEENIDLIYQLYLEIVDRAPFNMFILSKKYFVDIKRNFGDKCDYTFVYDNDKLIAFQINLSNHEELEAHFLGYNHDYLISHDLYLNLLLNSVRLGIERNKKSIIFSRTAMQIKSSIGAVPEDLYLYLNIQNRLLNNLVKLAFKYLNPPVVFNQRHPFGERREARNEKRETRNEKREMRSEK